MQWAALMLPQVVGNNWKNFLKFLILDTVASVWIYSNILFVFSPFPGFVSTQKIELVAME